MKVREAITSCLPNNSLKILVPVLEKFVVCAKFLNCQELSCTKFERYTSYHFGESIVSHVLRLYSYSLWCLRLENFFFGILIDFVVCSHFLLLQTFDIFLWLLWAQHDNLPSVYSCRHFICSSTWWHRRHIHPSLKSLKDADYHRSAKRPPVQINRPLCSQSAHRCCSSPGRGTVDGHRRLTCSGLGS